MQYSKLNMFTMVVLGMISVSACSTTKSPLNQVEDDVYFSRKEANRKDVYVPEVDVQEIIKANPPQYGNGQPQESPYRYDDSRTIITNPNAEAGYRSYKSAMAAEQQVQETEQQNFLNTVPYVGEEDEASEATRLRMQYSGSYNNFYDPYYSGYNASWMPPGVNVGWNNFTGWGVGVGVGFGWGWNRPWYRSYYSPFYDPFWGPFDPWGYGYYGYGGWGYYNSPFWGGWNGCGYNGGWGWNNGWCINRPGYWGHNTYQEAVAPRTQRPRQGAGSNMPRSSSAQQRANGVNGQMPAGTQQGQRTVVPRSDNEAKLIYRDGQPTYVAPEQYRSATPRSYNTYDRSVRRAEVQRDVTPVPETRPAVTPRPQRNAQERSNVEPTRRNDIQPAPSRTYEPAPQRSAPPQQQRQYNPPSGGSRGTSGGGSNGGGSTPRPRSR